eukprot:GHVN01040733.1.p1 GENE.GHVN01040733.1~~GHVN01040733.1.p1  ORF type:complete len:145 (+),score=19.19 GHVN01040733.1:431-865(+)
MIDVDSDLPTNGSRTQSCFFCYLNSTRGSFIPISFVSKVQSICCESTAASEIIAANAAMKHLMVVKAMLGDLLERGPPKQRVPILRVDNVQCLRALRTGWSQKLAYLSATIGIKISFLHDVVKQQLVEPVYVTSLANRADVGTK